MVKTTPFSCLANNSKQDQRDHRKRDHPVEQDNTDKNEVKVKGQVSSTDLQKRFTNFVTKIKNSIIEISNNPYSNNQTSQKPNDWQNGILGCFCDFKLCLISTFPLWPCVMAGKIGEALAIEPHCYSGCCQSIICPPFYNHTLRKKVVEDKGIEENPCMTCMFAFCCYSCSLSQIAEEVGIDYDWAMGEDIQRV